MTWDPRQYLRFSDLRLLPALDLLAKVDLDTPALIYDLGCGTGNVTAMLRARFPAARIVGLDSSPEMLEKARSLGLTIEWVEEDIATFAPEQKPDLLFSNAALHWLDAHESLLPRLVGMLRPGGVLAVQMPHNHHAPSHTGMIEAANAGPWRDRLLPHLRPSPVSEPAVYYDILRPHAAELEIWETEYLQVLEGEDPVVAWTRGTALKPLLDALEEPERSAFLEEYRIRMASAYPRRADGRTLFPFRRLFIVATMAA